MNINGTLDFNPSPVEKPMISTMCSKIKLITLV